MLITIKQRLLQQSRECNCKINNSIWPIFELVPDFIQAHLICKFQEHPVTTDWDVDDNVKQSYFSKQGDVTLLNDPNCPLFVQNFIHVNLVCKFQEDPIKTELWWRQEFSNCKSIGSCGCHSNQSFYWIFMKSLYHFAPPEVCYTRRMIEIGI